MTDLDARLLDAHHRDDRPALVTLYREAADAAEDTNAEGFYLTHAYIFALELGHPEKDVLHHRLKATGREA